MDYPLLIIYLIFFMEVISGFTFSFYAMFNYSLDREQGLNYSLLLIPALILSSLPFFDSSNYMIELVMIALSVHQLFLLLALGLKEKLTNKLILISGLLLPPILGYSGLFMTLYKLGFITLSLIYTALVLVFTGLWFKLNGADDFMKSQYLNIIAAFALVLSFNIYGLGMMLGLMALSLLIQGLHIVRLSKAYRDELDSRYSLIQEDFDEEVRKKVRTQLFYMEETQERMAEMAKIDTMTGVYNKKALLHALEDKIVDKRTRTFSLLIFDIDKFKTINDTYGHVVGDKCIVRVAKAAKDSIRDGDLVGRYGGDEFFVMLSEADLRTAIEVAHRLRKKVEDLEAPKLTVSVGIANYPVDAKNLKDLISHADAGLYQAKDKGRNTLGYIAPNASNKAN